MTFPIETLFEVRQLAGVDFDDLSLFSFSGSGEDATVSLGKDGNDLDAVREFVARQSARSAAGTAPHRTPFGEWTNTPTPATTKVAMSPFVPLEDKSFLGSPNLFDMPVSGFPISLSLAQASPADFHHDHEFDRTVEIALTESHGAPVVVPQTISPAVLAPTTNPTTRTRARTIFGAKALLALLRLVIDQRPFLAKHGEKMKIWQDILAMLQQDGFFVNSATQTIQTKTKALIEWQKNPNSPMGHTIDCELSASAKIQFGALCDQVAQQKESADKQTEDQRAHARKKEDHDRVGGDAIRKASMNTMKKRTAAQAELSDAEATESDEDDADKSQPSSSTRPTPRQLKCQRSSAGSSDGLKALVEHTGEHMARMEKKEDEKEKREEEREKRRVEREEERERRREEREKEQDERSTHVVTALLGVLEKLADRTD